VNNIHLQIVQPSSDSEQGNQEKQESPQSEESTTQQKVAA
jgi:hypothetical protein